MAAQFYPHQPPALLKLISHDLRWQLLTTLAQSDLKVQELAACLNRPQNLVPYHLNKLRGGGLVSEHRSQADQREVYYTLDLDEVQARFAEAGAALHPALSGKQPSAADLTQQPRSAPLRVLFLCTQNSARSQMAEGLLRARGDGMVAAFSAGTEAAEVRPLAVRAMTQMDIDISGQRSKHLDEFRDQRFDYIITVCDRARETCPVFPGDPVQIHWSFPDPAEAAGAEEVRLAAYMQTALGLNTRIGFLLTSIRRQLGEH